MKYLDIFKLNKSISFEVDKFLGYPINQRGDKYEEYCFQWNGNDFSSYTSTTKKQLAKIIKTLQNAYEKME